MSYTPEIHKSSKINLKPQVSIGMPVYNAAKFVREALDSLLAQTFIDFELIISDNASTDDTERICRGYYAKDKRIRYVRQPKNLGVLANFKFVLDEAVGEYFMWAAADDLKNPDFLKFCVAVLDQNSRVGLVYCGAITRNLITNFEVPSMTGFTTSESKFLRVLFRLAHPTPNLIYGLYRRSVIEKIKIKTFDYWDIYVGIWLELNSNIVVIPMSLYVIGTNGVRIPYSVTGQFINAEKYLKETGLLFKNQLGVVEAFILRIINRYLITKTTMAHNRLIKSTKG